MVLDDDLQDAEVPGARAGAGAHQHQAWVSSVFGYGITRACGFASSVILAQALGPTDRGAVASLIAWTFTVLGIGTLVDVAPATYFFARRGRAGASACLVVAVACAVVLVPVALGVNWLVFSGDGLPWRTPANWYTLIIPFTVLASVYGGVMLGEGRIPTYWGTRVAGEILALAVVASLAFTRRLSIDAYVAISIVGSAVSFGASWWMAGPNRPSLRSTWSDVREVASYCGRIMSTTVPAQVRLRLDQLAVSLTLSMTVMGYYAVASSWATIVTVVGSGLSAVIVARSVHADESDPASIEAAVQRVRRSAALAMIIAAGAALAAPIGVPLLFGGDYRRAIGPGVVLSLAAGVTVWKGFLHDLHRAIGRPTIGIVPEAIGLLVAVLTLPPFIRRFGGLGASLASLISYLALVVAFHIRMRREFSRELRLMPGLGDVRAILAVVRSYTTHTVRR